MLNKLFYNKNWIITFLLVFIGFISGFFFDPNYFQIIGLKVKQLNISADGIIGALGNLTGGFIGAMVAYFIARKQFTTDNNKIIQQQYNILRLILEELDSNHNILETFENELLQKDDKIINLLNSKWIDHLPDVIPLLNDETITLLIDYSNTITLLKRILTDEKETQIEENLDQAKETIHDSLEKLHKILENRPT